MNQLAFDLEPRQLARRTDPETSHAAAARVHEFSTDHKATILAALREYGPMTVHELEPYTGLAAHRVGKRMKELQLALAAAVVVDAEGKALTRGGARVWYAVEAG